MKNKRAWIILSSLLSVILAVGVYAGAVSQRPYGIATPYWYGYSSGAPSSYYLSFPTLTANDEAVGKAATQTLTNKTYTSPKINEDVAVTATATEINGLADTIGYLTFSVGTQTTNDIAVGVTVKDFAGTTIAGNYLIRLWLSDTAGGAPTSTAPDGGGTAANGWITSDGTEMKEITGEIYYEILTGADGDVTITFNDDDTANDWYLCGEINGRVYASAVISHE